MNDTFLTPKLFSDFVGQKRVVARIEIVIAAAKQRGEAVIPFSKGGSNTARNIELLCEACNRAKSASIQ